MADAIEDFMQAVKANDSAAVGRLLSDRTVDWKPVFDQTIPGGAFGETPLIAAVRARNREMIDLLLDAGADPNVRSKWWAGGFGVLDQAGLRESPELVQHLIDRGSRVDVHAAARFGMLDRLRELIDGDPTLVHSRGGDGMMPLHVAASLEIAQHLVEGCGANMDTLDIDHESTAAQYMVRDRQPIVHYLVGRGCRTDILMAAALGEEALVDHYLEADPKAIGTCVSARYFPMRDPRAGGSIYIWTLGEQKTAHLVAHEFGHTRLFQLLMDRSPAGLRLAIACELGDRAEARSILASGALALTDEEQARLVNAAKDGNLAKVRLMLDCGWKADAWDGGATALHMAAFHGNAAMVGVLVDAGAPIDVADLIHKSTPVGWAAYGSVNSWKREGGDYPAVIDLLLQRGAAIPSRIGVASDSVRIRLGLARG